MIWDSETGFGGNGTGELSLGSGCCVIDGPFANRILHYFGADEIVHCLSRGFAVGPETDAYVRNEIGFEAIGAILSIPAYEVFNSAFEKGAYHAIPNFVGGDFHKFTASAGM